MSLATHDLIQASPLCKAPSPSPLLLLLSLALSVSSCISSACLSINLPVYFLSYQRKQSLSFFKVDFLRHTQNMTFQCVSKKRKSNQIY